jgi:hypothetical protein
MARVDYDQRAASYDRGREMPLEGLAALKRAAAAETTPTPVIDHLDLLVLR